MMSNLKPPTQIDGTPVSPHGDPLIVNGETWLTLLPDSADYDKHVRMWSWSSTTGRVVIIN